MRDWWKAVTDLFFPRTCIVCGRTLHLREKYFCLRCYAGLPLTYFWELKDNPAEQVFWGRVSLHRVYTLFYYINEYRRPLHRFKYNNQVGIGLYLGEMLGQRITQDLHWETLPIHYIVPVPLHYRKKWKRGYNQSEIIAKGILKGLVTPLFEVARKQDSAPDTPPQFLPHLLQRKQFTKTQTQKTRIERWHNVSDAFRISPKTLHKVLNEREKLPLGAFGLSKVTSIPARPVHILLVDDVLTTGATLDACAQLLQQHLNCIVSIATLAYVE